MENLPVFSRSRVIVFSILIFFSFLWAVWFCIILFTQWDLLHRSERSITVVLLLSDIITMIMLPILLLRPFRIWLDTARCLFLLIAHLGSASAFAFWYPKLTCSTNSPDEVALCNLISLCTLVTSWVIPALIVVYLLALVVLAHRLRHAAPPLSSIEKGPDSSGDEEFHTSWTPPLTAMTIVSSPQTITFPQEVVGRYSIRTQPGSADSRMLSFGQNGVRHNRTSTNPSMKLAKPLRVSYY